MTNDSFKCDICGKHHKYDSKIGMKHLVEMKKHEKGHPVTKKKTSSPPSGRIRGYKKPVSKPEPDEYDGSLDIAEEQMDIGFTTRHSKDAVIELDKVAREPEKFIEVNMIRMSRVVDTFFIFADKPRFEYNDKKYKINEESIYLVPQGDMFVATSFYHENTLDPISFKQTNKGITGKALTLLYKNQLYQNLLEEDNPKYNLFIVLLLVFQLIIFGIALGMLVYGVPDVSQIISDTGSGGGGPGPGMGVIWLRTMFTGFLGGI